MNTRSLLRKIPYIDKEIRRLKPKIEDILLEFFDTDSKIIYLDVGANTGQTIDFINKLFNNVTIYSFEPTPELFEDLQQKYINHSNIHLSKYALADEDGRLDFYQSGFSPTNSCLEPNTILFKKLNHRITETLEKSTRIKVQGRKLDTWYEQSLNNENIDIVKLDTQGSEYNIINGGLKTLRTKVNLLYFEVHYLDLYKHSIPFYKIFELLYENGFYYYCHIASHRRNKYQVLESDVFFMNDAFIKPYE